MGKWTLLVVLLLAPFVAGCATTQGATSNSRCAQIQNKIESLRAERFDIEKKESDHGCFNELETPTCDRLRFEWKRKMFAQVRAQEHLEVCQTGASTTTRGLEYVRLTPAEQRRCNAATRALVKADYERNEKPEAFERAFAAWGEACYKPPK